MEDARYFRDQAYRCYRLALGSFDLDTLERLNALGDEFMQTAHELEHFSIAPAPHVDLSQSVLRE